MTCSSSGTPWGNAALTALNSLVQKIWTGSNSGSTTESNFTRTDFSSGRRNIYYLRIFKKYVRTPFFRHSTTQPTEDMLLHYQIARDRKLVDYSWDSMVKYQNDSFNNITILDLSPKNHAEPLKLTVELTFKTESLSENGLQVFLCAPRERGIMRDKNGLFSLLDPWMYCKLVSRMRKI